MRSPKTFFRLVLLAVVAGAGGALLSGPAHAGAVVEVVLVDRLDDPRGYCLDILGYKQRAKVERGLQGHSCYSYQGEVGVDQGFDREAVEAGRFHMPGFDVCMAADAVQPGARLGLAKCGAAPEQSFSLTAQGEIVSKSAPSLCVTVAGGEGAPGGGGRPVHLKRRLTLEPCDQGRSRYQRWRLRSEAD